MLEKIKVGIIGVGMVGGALCHYFEKKGIEPFLYDRGKKLGSPEEVNKADVIFICVPTPFDKKKGFDLSYVKDAVSKIKGHKVVVIKSTVCPGTTEMFQKKYSQHKFLFNPEFLVETKADEGMQRPDRQIVGYTKKSCKVADRVLKLLPKAAFKRIIPATEAEMIKYFGNNFLTIKVAFANQIYDLCQKIGVDYNTVKECASADKRIGPSHLKIYHNSYRGYGGKCFSKDIRALIQFADKQGINLKLHKAAERVNNELMKKQGIKDPENFRRGE